MFECIKRKLHAIVMGDLFPMYERFEAASIGLYNRLFSTHLPMSVKTVYVRTDNGIYIDVTEEYLTKRNWNENPKFGDEYLVYVSWMYNSDLYRYVFKNTAPMSFPPYTIEQLRSRAKFNKIASICVDSDSNYHDRMMTYAGPFHNFYEGHPPMDLEWIVPGGSSVELMDTKCYYKKIVDPSKLVNT